MSTRTNIIVKNGETKLFLYRHHDGYLAGAGADLAIELRKAGQNCTAFVAGLLGKQYEATSYCGPRPIYEVTSELHGDIEYAYVVKFDRNQQKAPQIGFAQRGKGEQEVELYQVSMGSLQRFVGEVNAAIAAQNARLRELQAENPGTFYGNMQPEPLLAVPAEVL
jgi:hypothetical protein